MSNPDELLDLAHSVVDAAQGDESVEAFAIRRVETEIEALRGEVDSLSSAEVRGVGVRVIDSHRQGYASTADLTSGGLAAVLDEARSNAAVGTPDEANVLPEPEEPADVGDLTDAEVLGLPVEDKIALALSLERAAAGADSEVRGVRWSRYGDTYTEVALASTRGVALTQVRTDAWAYTLALAGEGDATQTGLGLAVGRGPGDIDVEAAGVEAASRATRLLGATKPDSRRVPVVLDPYATAGFLGVLAGALSAEAALKGRSLFADRVGEGVAADHLTLLDDGIRSDGLATAPWDGEGVARRRTPIIQDGRLDSLLHNTWTARRYGQGATSTGNASRASHRSSPGVAATNLYLEPSAATPSELLAQAGEAVYVQEVAGLHSGANPISGEFSVGITGLAVRQGELAEPIREATVASTIIEMLRGIQTVADDLRFVPFGGSIGGCTVLIGEMSVGGR